MERRFPVWPILALLTGLGTLLAGSQYNCEPIEPVPTECYTNLDCAADDTTVAPAQYCAKDASDCDGIGVCEDLPVTADCPRLWAPVCGCDGVTYDNDCFAAVAGVSVDYEGACQVEPDYCWSNDMCADSEYCYFADCALETGVCVFRPEACVAVWDPVCGCDGQTYSNACYAAAAGMSVDYEGECEVEPTYCWSNDMCDESEYCYFADCALETGECVFRPEACIALWAPVCGCDGQTYSNRCVAAAAGMSVDYEGECETGPTTCWANDMCAESEYCYFADCAAETGECAFRPEACTAVWAPVCGCDGQTYGNACTAAAAGMSVDYEGECEVEPTYCWSNDMCAESEYCYFADCALETGECVFRPEVCIDLWSPVCGCDGETYSNSCYAAGAGMSVDYEGECENTPSGCWSDDMCDEGEYCFYEVCAAETGACVSVPEACPYLWDPVCGCDGQTYANACLAATSHVSVDYSGECVY